MKKNATRNALFMSVLSLLLCVSMLVGTTFAWFTDEVTSGINTIAAGNLDIEMYHTNGKVTDEKVASATDLFLDLNGEKILWEPGVVSYENIKIANVGSLALQYRLSLNIANENYLNGHGLSEVLKVVLLEDTIPAGASRADVMALANAALADPDYTLDGALNQLVEQGKLYPADSIPAGEASEITGALVIFWAPNSNDIDNLYNANNGQETSDKQPLHIDFGVKLEATQLMYEEDSFGPDYDKFTGFQPIAAVNGHDNTISYTESPKGTAKAITLDTAYQFRPTESADNGDLSEYLYYKVDFEVSADNDVPADSIMLAGYYKAWCGNPEDPSDPDSWNLNDGNWFALTNAGMDVATGETIRLVDSLAGALGGSVSVHYKDLLDYGNDGIGFLCGAKDLTGENAGTTLTVKLKMYETERDPNTGEGDSTKETGKVITIGEFKYTFGGLGVASADDLKDALADGAPAVKLNSDVALPDDMITVTEDTVINLNGHTLSGTSNSSATSSLIKVAAGAELTLTGDGKVTFEAANPDVDWNPEGFPTYANNTINCAGKLIIDGVTVENTTNPGGASYAIDCYPGADLVINSGVIDGHGKNAIRLFANSTTVATNVTVNGGTITGSRAIWIHLPGSNAAQQPPVNVTIKGGTLTSISDPASNKYLAIYSYSYGQNASGVNVTIEGGTFNGNVVFGGGSKNGAEVVNVTGGTFNGELGRYVEDNGTNNGWEDIAKP